MAAVQRLNHAVLYVGDVAASAAFYSEVLGMDIAHQMPGGAFMRSAGSANDHDLGLFQIGTDRPGPAAGRRGLYHLAWQVDTIEDLLTIGHRLSERGSLVGMSDHGASKSLYALDPDGIELEVMWAVPLAERDPNEITTRALSLETELKRWAGVHTGHEANVPHFASSN